MELLQLISLSNMSRSRSKKRLCKILFRRPSAILLEGFVKRSRDSIFCQFTCYVSNIFGTKSWGKCVLHFFFEGRGYGSFYPPAPLLRCLCNSTISKRSLKAIFPKCSTRTLVKMFPTFYYGTTDFLRRLLTT